MSVTLRKQTINKENLDHIFNLLSEKYAELGGTERVSLMLVGGAAIITRFLYRVSTLDIDALFPKTGPFLRAAEEIGKAENLPEDWINDEFVGTPSFSAKLADKMTLYKSFSDGLLNVYSLPDPYLIAMKMRSNRPTSGDLDDVIHMVAELSHLGNPVSFEQVERAHKDLYGIGLELCSPLFVEELKTVTAMTRAEIEELYYPSLFD